MKQSSKDKKSGKAGKAKKPKYDLTYFLDHPQIQRHECVGNQEPPKANSGGQFAHVGKAVGHTADKGQQIKASQEKSDQSRSVGGAFSNLKKNLGF